MGVAENLTRFIIGLFILIALTLLFSSAASAQTDWDSSPYNWKNNENNWENNSSNWKNNPHNWKNSPHKYNNDRIIRDNQGRAKGYAMPKKDGGVNYYDLDGNRKRYKPGQN
jgi:hypothetical protein